MTSGVRLATSSAIAPTIASRCPTGSPRSTPLDAAYAVVTRTLRFQTGDVGHTTGWLIEGRPFTADSIEAEAKLGTMEGWRLIADFHHPVHVHVNPFQVLSRGIGDPGPLDAGWKDTIDCALPSGPPAIRFDDYSGVDAIRKGG